MSCCSRCALSSTAFHRLQSLQVVEVYRSKLRDDIVGSDGDEIARKRIEDYANKIRPRGFLVGAPTNWGGLLDLMPRTYRTT